MKRKLVQINTVCNTSTGKIMRDIQKNAQMAGYETISFVGRRELFSDVPCERFGNAFSFWSHVVLNTVFDRQGHGSYFVTRKLVRRLREVEPDIIHLHNLHGYYLNLPVLFGYLRNEFKGKIFWTLHDCWPFTGHCAYFLIKKCDRWMEECHHCPNKREYPISLMKDASRQNFREKKKMFGDLKDLVIIVPSKWMKELVLNSFLKDKPVKVVNNGINLQTFSHKESSERVLKKYQIPLNKKILLGVANIWEKRKGLEDFLKLSKEIDEEYLIVIVGLSKRQIRKMPNNIKGIEKTENQEELAELYSAAHIFINPSLEESFSLVTLEAIACGTPVIVLDTSAVKELVNEKNGVVLNRHEAKDYLDAIIRLELTGLLYDDVRKTAERFDEQNMTRKILQLYG